MNTPLGFFLLVKRCVLLAALVLFIPVAFGAQPVITSVASALAVVDNAFTYQIEASGAPTSYAATGLPAGLGVNSATGLISGSASTAGVFDVELSATNADGTDTASLALTIGTVGTFVAVADPRYLAFDASDELAVSGASGVGYASIFKVSPTGSSRFFAVDSFEWLGVVYDPAGNLYAARLFGEVSKITPEGVETTVVPASGTQVHGLAIDSAGNLYFANRDNNLIGKVTPAGVVSTFSSGAAIAGPTGLAFDSLGNLFVANAGNNTVAKVTPDGTAVTFASGFDGPWGLVFDSAGTLYVSSRQSGTVHKVTGEGVVTTLVTGLPAFSPTGLAFDQAGALYVANQQEGIVLRIGAPPSSPPVITSDAAARAVANQGFGFQVEASGSPASFSATGLPPGIDINPTTGAIRGTATTSGSFSVTLTATNAAGTATATFTLTVGTFSLFKADPLLNAPTGLVFHPDGNLFVSNFTGEILKIAPDGSLSVYVAGLDGAQDIALDSQGNLYVSRSNGFIHKITPSPLVTSVFATGLTGARGLAFDQDDNLYVARVPFDPNESSISKITPNGVVSTFVQDPDSVFGRLVFDREGNLYATNQLYGNSSIIKIAPDGSSSRYAAPFTYPGDIALDRDGALYVPDESPIGGIIDSIMRVSSTGALGAFSGAGDPVTPELLNSLAFDSADNLYIGNASGIYRVTFPIPPPVITSPTTATGTLGIPFNYTITATNDPTEFAAEGLPSGLVLNATTGVITGTPTQVGSFSVDLAAGNSTGTGFAVLDLQIMSRLDRKAPVIAKLKATPSTLSPANHQLVGVTVTAKVTDNMGVTSFKIINVTSSEPDQGLGGGDVPDDIQITGDLTVNLRAELSPRGHRRTYVITVEARDASGNTKVKTVTVAVSKNKGRK